MNSVNAILGGQYAYVNILQLVCFATQIWASQRLTRRRYELDVRERELDKTEKWLDNREIKLEKKIDKMRQKGVRF